MNQLNLDALVMQEVKRLSVPVNNDSNSAEEFHLMPKKLGRNYRAWNGVASLQ